MEKYISLKVFLKIRNRLKKENKKLIATNGCFDILHPGHIKIFEESKNIGDKLLVLINSDKSIKLNKGNKRPILKLKERISILNSIKYIDYLLVFNELTPEKILLKIKPDILTKGSEYKKTQIAGFKIISKNGGKIKLIKMFKKYSTTSIIRRIKNL
tara:strand:- start:254 stop:724 length:471 start_codon:yes stop_codon:yes gene_type:complete